MGEGAQGRPSLSTPQEQPLPPRKPWMSRWHLPIPPALSTPTGLCTPTHTHPHTHTHTHTHKPVSALSTWDNGRVPL